MLKAQTIILLFIACLLISCKSKSIYKIFLENLELENYDTVYVVSNVSCGGCLTDFFEKRIFTEKSILVFDERSPHYAIVQNRNLRHVHATQQYLDSVFDYFGNVIILSKASDSIVISKYPNY